MNIQNNTPATPLRQRMIEDMAGRNLGRQSRRNYLDSCARFAAFLGRAPETATADDIRRFQLFLIESGASIVHRNRIMTGLKFLLRVTLRRHDLAAEIYHLILTSFDADSFLGFPKRLKSESLWRPKEVRHGCSDWIARGLRERQLARAGEGGERRQSGASASGAGCYL